MSLGSDLAERLRSFRFKSVQMRNGVSRGKQSAGGSPVLLSDTVW